MRRFVLVFVGVFLGGLAMTSSLAKNELITGLVVALLIAFVSMTRVQALDGLKVSVWLPFYFLRYLFVFLLALIRANFDVARRVISPHLDIKPAIVNVHTELHSDLGRMWLANSITLTPGTLSVDVEGDTLKVHWIDISPGTDLVHATRQIASNFETALQGMVR